MTETAATGPSSAERAGGAPAPNPFPGPRPFSEDDDAVFFGRERELTDLLTMVLVERAILVHGPSGSGKSSLIHAGLVPRARTEGFDVLPVARVRHPGRAVEHLDAPSNRYVENVVQNWRVDERFAPVTGTVTLASALEVLGPAPEPGRLLILDQFEELFVIHPERWKDRGDLFRQLQEALDRDPLLRVLVVVRDDYLARLERFTPLLRDRLRARYALRGLDHDQAIAATVQPFAVAGLTLRPEAAERLVGKLLVEPAEGPEETYEREYVEPLQLQIVCSAFFEELTTAPAGTADITAADIDRLVDVNRALVGYCDRAAAGAIKGHPTVSERRVRLWLERKLVTAHRTRKLVLRGDQRTEGLPNDVVDELARRQVLHEEPRGRDRWYELSHDRLVDAVLASNRAWFGRTSRRRLLWGGALGGASVVVLALIVGSFLAGRDSDGGDVVTKHGSIGEAGAVETFVVEGTQGQLLTVAMMYSSDRLKARMRLLGPEGALAESVGTESRFPAVSAAVPATGSYRLEVTGVEGSTGYFELGIRSWRISGSPRRIQPGSPVQGSIATANEVDLLQFEGARGAITEITMSGDLDSYLTLVTPTGAHVFDDDSAGEGDATIALLLPEDGTYELRASSVGRSRGTYTARVEFLPRRDLVDPVQGTLDDEDPVHVYTIRNDQGGAATVRLRPAPGLGGMLHLNGPGGSRLKESTSSETGDEEVLVYPITPGQTYLLLVASTGSPSVPYSLSVDVQLALDLGTAEIRGELPTPGRFDVYRFAGEAGSVATISLTPGATLDPTLALFMPDGTPLLSRNEADAGQEELLGARLPVRGDYLLTVSTPDDSPSAGTYELRLSQTARGPA